MKNLSTNTNFPMIDMRAATKRHEELAANGYPENRSPAIRCSKNLSTVETLTRIPDNVLSIMHAYRSELGTSRRGSTCAVDTGALNTGRDSLD